MGQYDPVMTIAKEKKGYRPRAIKKDMIGEYHAPAVRWLDNAECPICGGGELMDALGMGLCVDCNKFVKPKKRR